MAFLPLPAPGSLRAKVGFEYTSSTRNSPFGREQKSSLLCASPAFFGAALCSRDAGSAGQSCLKTAASECLINVSDLLLFVLAFPAR